MSDNQDSDSEVNFNFNNRDRLNVDRDGANHGPYGGGANVPFGRGDDNFPMRRPAHIKPDPFTGEEDWDQYIAYFEDCAELCRWSEREKLLYLSTSLKQQARVHCSSLARDEKSTYVALVYSLEQRFGSKRQQSRWISKLQNRTRGRNETIGGFGDEIRLYSQKAYVTLDSESQEMLALQQFYKNVSPEMRCRLMDRDCRTIREAVEIVERYEEVMGKAGSQMQGVSNSGTVREGGEHIVAAVSTTNRGGNKDIEDIKGTLKKIDERLTKLETRDRPRYQPRACYECGSTKHFIKNCPHRRADEPRQGNQGNANPSRP